MHMLVLCSTVHIHYGQKISDNTRDRHRCKVGQTFQSFAWKTFDKISDSMRKSSDSYRVIHSFECNMQMTTFPFLVRLSW